tara:strand:+ start:2976 stop:5546 length:2571 start_codon:yes stop_codon:yes gene_type:complete
MEISLKLSLQLFFPLILSYNLFAETLPLSQRYFHHTDMGYDYNRGTYLIVLADESLEPILLDEDTGDFIHFKKTQGYDVEIITLAGVGGTANYLRLYLQYYYENIDPMLEYVLLVGDINGLYAAIPSFTIPSYNEGDLDVTDYPYTFFDNNSLEPEYFIGRWAVRSENDLKNIKMRSIQYVKMDYISDPSFLNDALLVAGNYSDSGTWPVTPVWTSKWLMDELYYHGAATVDTAFFHLHNQQVNNPLIASAWNSGVGVINYRGWGDANGWHKPYFHREDVDPGLNNGWRMPVVMSFVCNTGDFGNDFGGSGLDKCFGEVLTTGGSINNPKGAAAMIGPSDLDTDTRFNNVMCGVMWDELLEERIPELAPALHAGKQALIKEFDDLEVNSTNIAEFYHHVYGVLGDPSLPVWLMEPGALTTDLGTNPSLSSSHISTIVRDESGAPLMDVVGALLYNGDLIGKGLSNQDGYLDIDFEDVPNGSTLNLYLNKPQFFQKYISLNFSADDGTELVAHDYLIPDPEPEYGYNFIISDYNWQEISDIGENLYLVDDSIIRDIDLGFNFKYYGETFNKLTVCSNGWVSFLPCLNDESGETECAPLPYFFNNSITNPLGSYGMIAPFFDDLDDNQGIEPFDVYFWTNGVDSIIVEWDNVANGEHDEDCIEGDQESCPRETFQLILDGANTDELGNGAIIFQYKEIHDIDDHGCTVGIEAPDKDEGVEYLFNHQLAEEGASGLANGLAIKFTTEGNGMGINPSPTPQNFTLIQNYPNPFNPSTTIQYRLNQKGTVNISVYNLSGQKIRQLVDSNQDPGQHSVSWDGKDEKGITVGSGMYFYRLNVHSSFSGTRDGLSKTGKMVLLR